MIFVIQKWAIRNITGLKRRESCRKAFKELLTSPGLYKYLLLGMPSKTYTFYKAVETHATIILDTGTWYLDNVKFVQNYKNFMNSQR